MTIDDSKDHKDAGFEPQCSPTVEPTDKREIWAWWLYMAAMEPVSVAVLQLFLPSILDSLSLLIGHPPGQPSVRCTKDNKHTCILFHIGSLAISGSTFSYSIIALAVALQALVFILFGALADYGTMRKTFLTVSTIAGSVFCVAVLGIRGPLAAWIGAALHISITVGFGVSMMLYNSYLPLLSEGHPQVTLFQSDDPLEKAKQRELVSSSLSTKSYMVGYGSAGLFLAACVGYLSLVNSPDISHARHCVAACGLIWGLGAAAYPLWNLKSRPGPSLPPTSHVLGFSVTKTRATLGKGRQLPHLFWFLAAFFLYSDGCNTIGTVFVLFARNVLKATDKTLILCSILATFCGIVGNLFFFTVQKAFRLTGKTMLVIVLSGFLLLTGYGGMGTFMTTFGLRHQWELFMLAGIYGFLMGAMQSFSRVIYAEMIPPGDEAEFFALYAITDKGSSWIGPVIQALVATFLPDQRLGFFFLTAMVVTPFPVLIWLVDPVEGKDDAIAFAKLYDAPGPLAAEVMTEEKSP